MVPRFPGAAASLHSVWVDAGTRDDFFLDLGALAYRDALAAVGLPDDRVRFELFDATHAQIDYRYPLAIAWLAERLTPTP